MTWRSVCRVLPLSLPLLLLGAATVLPPAPVGFLGAMGASAHQRPTLPCRIGTAKATCIIDTGSSVALTLPPGMAQASGAQVQPWSEGIVGATGVVQQAQVYTVTLGMAGERADVWAVAPQGYAGLPLVGDPGLRALRAVVVVDAAQGTDWFVVDATR